MKKDDKVLIYHDPVTKTDPEGEATLFTHTSIHNDPQMEYWYVVFPGDDKTPYFRSIYTGPPLGPEEAA